MIDHKHFFDYFQREMAYLRHEGARFSSSFPKVAARLDFSNVESADPHVERLLQSFSFLTARLQRDVEDLFPRISTALLETLYPQFIAPIPSYAITKFETCGQKGKLTGRFRVEKGTQLYVHGMDGDICRFQTCSDLDLYPLEMLSVDILPTYDLPKKAGHFSTHRVLRLHLRSVAGVVSELDLRKLRFHIVGDPILQNKIYEALFLENAATAVSYGSKIDPTHYDFPQPHLTTAVGFDDDEAVMPYPDHGHPGYRLLQEYFAYPQKFMFFDVDASAFQSDEKEFTLYIEISDAVALEDKDFDISNIQLGCVPMVNLFKKISEPIRITHKTVDYRLVADQRREDTMEIHSVQRVLGSREGMRDPIEYAPYFSYTHAEKEKEQSRFWHARRSYSKGGQYPGNETYISFVDYEFNASQPPDQSVYAEILCTNRSLARSLTAGTELQSDTSIPVERFYCMDRPTSQHYLNREAVSQWRLISHLALGHLSLSDNAVSLKMLRELVSQYGDFEDGNVVPELNIMKKFEATRVTRRLGYDAWRGFVHGTKFTLTLEDSISRDTRVFLFSQILNHVLPQFTSVNSFSEFEVRRIHAKGIWKIWQPRSGNKALA